LKLKLDWLDRLTRHLAGRRTGFDRSVLCGDLNVLSDGPQKAGCLGRTPEERKLLQALRDAGFVDLYRRVNPSGPGLNYCFNRLASPTSRLQLLLGSENAADSVLDARVDIEYRRPIKVSCPLGSSQLSQST